MGKLTFGSTGLSYEVRKVDLSSRSAPKCPRCGKTVYFNEEKKALGKSWHSTCFTCVLCNKGLDSVNANGHQGEIYCNPCHRREFGPRGYGYAGGASGLSTETSTLDILLGRSRHSSSSSTSSPQSPKSPMMEKPWSQSVHQQPSPQQNGTQKPKQNPPPPQKLIDRDNMECCPRCGTRVYFAEEVKALKRKWHKPCFKCAHCEKMLDAGRCTSHQGEVYCQACYRKSFGPQGYGYGGHTVGNNKSYRFHKSTTLPSRAPSSASSYIYNGDSGVHSDMNGAKREWTDHAEDIRYMKQLAAELDQFE